MPTRIYKQKYQQLDYVKKNANKYEKKVVKEKRVGKQGCEQKD